MGFGRRGYTACVGVHPAATGLGGVTVSSCMSSICASSGESVEVELYLHSSVEGKVDGLEWGLWVVLFRGSLALLLIGVLVEHARYLPSGLPVPATFLVRLRPPLVVIRASGGLPPLSGFL